MIDDTRPSRSSLFMINRRRRTTTLGTSGTFPEQTSLEAKNDHSFFGLTKM